jgi:uncharacterized protein YabN with tetrapyrrole methylase and pyrophosphatase domain
MGTGDSPLLEAHRIQALAAKVGFDWPDARGPIAKVKEEMAEVERAWDDGRGTKDGVEDEIGDLLFAVVNLARKLAIDPSAALARANDKFKGRFAEVERLATARGLELGRVRLEELDKLWDEVKESGGG